MMMTARRSPFLLAAALVAAVTVSLPAHSVRAHPTAATRDTGKHYSGGYKLRLLSEHVGRHRCRRTILNGIELHGRIIGTAYCGRHDEAFLRMPGGKQFRYRLPHRLARNTLASNIASDGSFVVVGTKRRHGRETSYFVSANRKHRRALHDPLAHGHGTVVNGLNRHHAAVGTYCPTRRCLDQKPFVFRHGKFRPFHLHIRGAFLVTPSQINDYGTIAGFYLDQYGIARCFVKHQNQPIYPVYPDHAGSKPGTGCFLSGLSNDDWVAGTAVNNRNRIHTFVNYEDEVPGFVSRTPGRPKSHTELLGVRTHVNPTTGAYTNEIVGYWYDAAHHRPRGLIGVRQ